MKFSLQNRNPMSKTDPRIDAYIDKASIPSLAFVVLMTHLTGTL